MNVSHTETYDMDANFAIADLALPDTLEERLRSALDEDDASQICTEIEDQITSKLRECGVDTSTGEWLGEWSAAEIVAKVLDRHSV